MMTDGAEAAVRGRADASSVVLDVQDLTSSLPTPDGRVNLVDGVSFELRRGQTLGIVGESGSGKTMLVRSITGIGPTSAVVSGKVSMNGVDLASLSKAARRRHIGVNVGMVFQNPMTSLNPVVPIGRQLTEGVRYHRGLSRRDARERAVHLLDLVGIPDAKSRLQQYPFQLSGGMRQRVMIAIALASDPAVLIADEATTALDVTVQKLILDLIQEIQRKNDMAVVIISHDLAVVSGRTDQLAVMYGGRVVESGPTQEVFAHHRHRYTSALLRSIPDTANPPHTRLEIIPGTPRIPTAGAVGCSFVSRCRFATDECREIDPVVTFEDADVGHWYRCHWPEILAPQGASLEPETVEIDGRSAP